MSTYERAYTSATCERCGCDERESKRKWVRDSEYERITGKRRRKQVWVCEYTGISVRSATLGRLCASCYSAARERAERECQERANACVVRVQLAHSLGMRMLDHGGTPYGDDAGTQWATYEWGC